MKIIEAGGARLPAIGLGTWRLSGPAASDIVARAIEFGYRHIDTARMYANEREVGEGIRRAGIARDELFVTTKVWWEDLAEGRLQQAAEAAIEALGIGPVDLLLIHWPNAGVALEESIGALNDTIGRGLTRHIGVANFTSAMMDEAVAISAAPLVCNQVEYHPFLSQEAVLDACARHDMALVAYSPIGRGGELLNDPVISAIAERHGRTPAQIVLRWEVQQARVAAIPRTSNPDRLRENFDVFSFELAEDEMDRITGLTKRRQRLVDPDFAPNWDRV
ncbi:oxidoreductase [Aureimonas endophytica]|uniref:Oxidoreductase n=1 Tax=Aureimonas endophytica TaxID=2027858 RepID=A0A916ZD98_9HYPH|nr:aldo/keto reductase [Aureimonas endophytica]GGD89604.1 oxidoreductase [Aureimonas endophytica]